MKLAMAQMRMSASLQENLNEALQYMEQAAAAGADLTELPLETVAETRRGRDWLQF